MTKPESIAKVQGLMDGPANHPEASLPPLCRVSHVLKVVPIGRSTIWLWARQGRFPRPVKYGAITVWKREDVLTWLKQAAADFNP